VPSAGASGWTEGAFTVGLDMGGIQLRPIRLRRSLYLRIPMEVAQLLGVTKDTGFVLTLKQGEDCILMYKVA